jgi:hypothetical protein
MTFRWKMADLDGTGLRTTIGASVLTLGNLLKHLAFAEDYKFTVALRGEPPGEPWPEAVRPSSDWTFASAVEHSPAELYAMWDSAVDRSRRRLSAALGDGELDQSVHMADGAAERSRCEHGAGFGAEWTRPRPTAESLGDAEATALCAESRSPRPQARPRVRGWRYGWKQ